MNISPSSALSPLASPSSQPRSQAPRTAQSQLKVLLDKVAEHIKNETKSCSDMRGADIQNEVLYADYMNAQRPSLNLHNIRSMEWVEECIGNSCRSGVSHTRFLVRDDLGRNYYYMEFRHPQNAPPTVIAFNHAGDARHDRVKMVFDKFRREIEGFKDFKEICFLQVDTFKQANEYDAVLFAAHSAWVALDHAEDYEKLHAMALAGTKYVRDDGRYNPSIKPQLFSDSFYEYEQLRDATPPDIDKLPGNFMSIFDFRLQLLMGVRTMSHTPA